MSQKNRETPTPDPLAYKRTLGREALMLFLPNSRPAKLERRIEEAQARVISQITDIEQMFNQATAVWKQTQVLHADAQAGYEQTGKIIPADLNRLWDISQHHYRQYQALLSDAIKWLKHCQEQKNRRPDSFRRLGLAIDKKLLALDTEKNIIDNLASDITRLVGEYKQLRVKKTVAHQAWTESQANLNQAQQYLDQAQATLMSIERMVLVFDQKQTIKDDILAQTEREVQSLIVKRIRDLIIKLEAIMTLEEEIEAEAREAWSAKWQSVAAHYRDPQIKNHIIKQIMKDRGMTEEKATDSFFAWMSSQADRQAATVYEQVWEKGNPDIQSAIDQMREDWLKTSQSIEQLQARFGYDKSAFVDATINHEDAVKIHQSDIERAKSDLAQARQNYDDCLITRNLCLAGYLSNEQSLEQVKREIKRAKRDLKILLNQSTGTLPTPDSWPAIPVPKEVLQSPKRTSWSPSSDDPNPLKGFGYVGQEFAHHISGIPYKK